MLRNLTFFSLAEFDAAVKPLVERLNNRPMKKLGKSRRELFEELERCALRPLPARPYELATWAKPRVQINYHLDFDGHYYSVPYQLVGQQLDVRATERMVEILRGGKRVTSHARSYEKHKYTTKPEHMPRGHREWAEWTPARLVAWAKNAGPATAALVEELMSTRRHPEHGFKSCLGIMRLREKYGDDRVERACARALARRACSYRSVKAILQNNLDGDDAAAADSQGSLPLHENVRGAGYYH